MDQVEAQLESAMEETKESKPTDKASTGTLKFSVFQLPHSVAHSTPLDPEFSSSLGQTLVPLEILSSELKTRVILEKAYPLLTAKETPAGFNGKGEMDISYIKAGTISSTQLYFDVRGIAGLFSNFPRHIPQIVLMEVLPFASHKENDSAHIPIGETECDDNGTGAVDPSGNIDFDTPVIVGLYANYSRELRVSLFACEVDDNEARVLLAYAQFDSKKLNGDEPLELDLQGRSDLQYDGTKVIVWNGNRRKAPKVFLFIS